MASVQIIPKREESIQMVIDRISTALVVKPDGSIEIRDFSLYNDCLPIIRSALKFDSNLSSIEAESIIKQSIYTQIGSRTFTIFNLVAEIDRRCVIQLKIPLNKFYLSTRISIRSDHFVRFTKDKSGMTSISVGSTFPSMLKFDNWFMSGFGNLTQNEPFSYACLWASATARTESHAASIMLEDTEIYLAAQNLYCTRRMLFQSGRIRPLGAVRFGPFQFIHNDRGSVYKEQVWYELECSTQEHPKDVSQGWSDARRFVRKFLRHLQNSPLKATLKRALQQFNAALNGIDRQICFVRLWSVLEIIVGTPGEPSKLTAGRIAFMCKDREFVYEKLLRIEDARHSYVHAGSEAGFINEMVESIRSLVASILVDLTMTNMKLSNISHLRDILSLPRDSDRIKNQISTARAGLKILS